MKKMTPNYFTKIFVLCFALIASSCNEEGLDGGEAPVEQLSLAETTIVKRYFGDQAVYGQLDNNGNLISDDMLFDKAQLSKTPQSSLLDQVPNTPLSSKLSLSSSATKWPNGVVVYKLGAMSNRLRGELQKAMDEWSSKTNVSFKVHTNESYFVTISESNDVCSTCGRASIGVVGTSGTCKFGPNSSASLIAHELGHTLGYLHEQSRSDRDTYVTILFDNIQAGKERNFEIRSNALKTTKAFDIKSIMMYHPYAFTKQSGVPTIVDARTGQPYQGAQQTVSVLDIEGTNSVYPKATGGNTGDDTNPGSGDICEGVSAWQSGRQYRVGDKVIYQGYLYEADFSRWNQIGPCGAATQSADKCSGVAAYNGAARYSVGDKVTYNGSLYTLTSELKWRNDGQCGS
jgi:chitodextrinase